MSRPDVSHGRFSRQRRQVARIAEAQWWLCFWCCLPMTIDEVTRDHVIPRSKGGGGIASGNIVAACWSCNHQKGAGAAPSERHIQLRKRQHLRREGLYAEFPSGRRRAEQPEFGRDEHGNRLVAPQYGII